jgi:hypothetical protein
MLIEVPAERRPEVIRAYLNRAGRRGRSWGRTGEARHYFGVRPDASDEELRAVAERYPVFHVVETATTAGRFTHPAEPAT